MKTALMGIGFVMGISLASSCVFGETSQKRLDGYSGAELRQALDEVINRLTSAGYQQIPGALKYEFDASHVGISPESKPASPESGEDKTDELSNDAALDNDSDHSPFNSFSPFLQSLISQNKNKHDADNDDKQDGISKLSEKKKAMIFCVMQEMQNRKVSFVSESQKPIVQKCMQILRYVKEGKIPQNEMDIFLPIETHSGGIRTDITFKGSNVCGGVVDQVRIERNGKLKLLINNGADDAWFEELSLRVDAYDKKHAQGSVPLDSSKPSPSGSETGESIDVKSWEGSKPTSNIGDEADSSDSEESEGIDAWISKLSEKQKAFIRCAKYKVGQEGAELSEDDMKSQIVQKCLQILHDVVPKERNHYLFDVGAAGSVDVDSDLSIEIDFRFDNIQIRIAPDGKIEKIIGEKFDNDYWFDAVNSVVVR